MLGNYAVKGIIAGDCRQMQSTRAQPASAAILYVPLCRQRQRMIYLAVGLASNRIGGSEGQKPAAARAGPAGSTPPRGKDSGIAPIVRIRNGTVAAFATASGRSALRRRRPIPGGVPPSNRRHRADSGTGDGGEMRVGGEPAGENYG